MNHITGKNPNRVTVGLVLSYLCILGIAVLNADLLMLESLSTSVIGARRYFIVRVEILLAIDVIFLFSITLIPIRIRKYIVFAFTILNLMVFAYYYQIWPLHIKDSVEYSKKFDGYSRANEVNYITVLINIVFISLIIWILSRKKISK